MLAIIAAKSKNNVIGFEGKMPWKQRTDLQHFKSLTYGHDVIMGRKTFESMNSKPLPDRHNTVLTSNISAFVAIQDFMYPNKRQDFTISSDLKHAADKFYRYEFPNRMYLPTGFIIGGERLYREGMEIADRLFITELDCEVQGDAFFPEIDMAVWKKVAEEKHKADEHNQYDYNFVTYARIPPPQDKRPGWNIS